MDQNGRAPDVPRTWGGHRARPAGTLDLRLSRRALLVGPLLYLAGMSVAGVLAAEFLAGWLFGVVLFGLVVAAWIVRDASQRSIPGAQLWGLAGGFVPFAGLALYLMRREAHESAC